MGNQSREGIIGNFGADGRDLRNEGRLPRIGEADDAHIGHQFQFKKEPSFFPRLPEFSVAGSLKGRGSKMRIAPATPTPWGHNTGFSLFCKIAEDFSAGGIADDCSYWNGKDEGRSAAPFLIFSFTVLATFGVVMLLVAKIEKRGDLAISLEDHVSAFSPVAAVGSSTGDMFFTAKAKATVSSVSSFDEDFRFINKFDRSNSPDT